MSSWSSRTLTNLFIAAISTQLEVYPHLICTVLSDPSNAYHTHLPWCCSQSTASSSSQLRFIIFSNIQFTAPTLLIYAKSHSSTASMHFTFIADL